MGLFGGLFQKEACCICGGKTGMLDKKTADGKICKDCTKKLSVWFEDYKTSTAEDLKSQIASKEKDLLEIRKYHFTKVFGEMGVILIDEANRVFTAFPDTSGKLFGAQRSVKSIEDVMDLGPDIISFDQIRDIEIDVKETTREDKKTVDGKQVSYDPPHLVYMYNFTLRIQTDHPYIKRIYVPLNKEAVQIKNVGRRIWTDPGRKLAAWATGLPTLVKEEQAAVYDNESLLHSFFRSKYEMPDSSYGFRCTIENWDDIQKYQYYLFAAREIEQCLTKAPAADSASAGSGEKKYAFEPVDPEEVRLIEEKYEKQIQEAGEGMRQALEFRRDQEIDEAILRQRRTLMENTDFTAMMKTANEEALRHLKDGQ